MKTKRFATVIGFVLFGICILLAKDLKKVTFNVPQMVCENCEKKVKDNIRFEKGVKDIQTNLAGKTVQITYDSDKTDVARLAEGFKKIKYDVTCVDDENCEENNEVCEEQATDCCKK